MTLPHIGSMSDRRMPLTFVGETPNSPRYSTGASGLGSHMSMCDGPPRIHRMMTDGSRPPFVFGAETGFDSARSSSARLRPAVPSRPARRKDRRALGRGRGEAGQPRRAAPPVVLLV